MSRGRNAGNLGQGSNWIRRGRRIRIYARDGWTCVWCGCRVRQGRRGDEGAEPLASLDHFLPRCLGGTNVSENLVTACTDCNLDRGDRPALAYAFERAGSPDKVLNDLLDRVSRPLPPKESP